jgi:Uma2 family endonuclease
MATIQNEIAIGPPPIVPRSLPPLQNGDRLTRAEFERRYAAMPNVTKAELIEGVVYMPSPVSEQHGSPHFDLITWLGVYRWGTPGVRGGDNTTLRLDLDNEPQPDAFLRLLPEFGGQSSLSPEGYVEGAPELVAEISATSASYDLHAKLNVYRRNNVREYIVWRVWDNAIDWLALREERYVQLAADADGRFRSEVFPGLWLDSAALLQGDLTKVNQVLQQGLASPEHAAFVGMIQDRAASRRG